MLREPAHQRLADALAAIGRPHEQIFKIDAVPAPECGEIQEPDGKTGGLALPFGDIAEQARRGRKQRGGDRLGRGVDLALQLFVVGKLAHQCEYELGIGRLRGADREAHADTAISTLDNVMHRSEFGSKIDDNDTFEIVTTGKGRIEPATNIFWPANISTDGACPIDQVAVNHYV